MKYVYLLVSFLTLSACIAQENIMPYGSLQNQPEYPGGIKAFYEHLINSMEIPEIDHNMTARMTISFVVEKDGTLSDVKALSDPGYGLAEQAVKAVKACPEKWKPGMQNDKPVRANFLLPVTVNITGEEETPPPAAEQKATPSQTDLRSN